MEQITIGAFYFIRSEYFEDHSDKCLMQNKPPVDGVEHNRPYFCAFRDPSTGLLWMVSVSTQVDKFHMHARGREELYKRCGNLLFGDVLGRENAFLIQNMCPVSERYIERAFIDRNTSKPVVIEKTLSDQVIHYTKKALPRVRRVYDWCSLMFC